MKRPLLIIALAICMISGITVHATVATLPTSTTGNASSDPFSGLNSGDTILINGTFNLDADYSAYQNQAITYIVDGASAQIYWSSNSALYLGAGSRIRLTDGGQLTNSSPCNSNKAIYLDGSKVASCNGSGGTLSLLDINAAGGLTSTGSALPVTWVNFEATVVQYNSVNLQWSTATEENNSHFEVEYSVDGTDFTVLSSVNSQSENGFSNAVLNYCFTHVLRETNKTAFYRIKQLDFNGSFSYSPTKKIVLETTKPVSITNLTDMKLNVQVSSERSDDATISIADLSGRTVYQSGIETKNVIQFAEAGIYIITVINNNEVTTIKQLVY